MSIQTNTHQNNSSNAKRAVTALLAAVAIASASGSALARPTASADRYVDSREFRAEAATIAARHLVPINGAQIMGGFGGVGDLVDTDTGEVFHR